jgi:hypothetical protein
MVKPFYYNNYHSVFDYLFDEEEQIELELTLREDPCFEDLIIGLADFKAIGTGCYPGDILTKRYLTLFSTDDIRLNLFLEGFLDDTTMTKTIAEFDNNYYFRAVAINKRHENVSEKEIKKYKWNFKEYHAFKEVFYSYDDITVNTIENILGFVRDLDDEYIKLKLIEDAELLHSFKYVANQVIFEIMNEVENVDNLAEIVIGSANIEWTQHALEKIDDSKTLLNFVEHFIDHYDVLQLIIDQLNEIDITELHNEKEHPSFSLLHEKLIDENFFEELKDNVTSLLINSNTLNQEFFVNNVSDLSYSVIHTLGKEMDETETDNGKFLENLDVAIFEHDDIEKNIISMWKHLRTKM